MGWKEAEAQLSFLLLALADTGHDLPVADAAAIARGLPRELVAEVLRSARPATRRGVPGDFATTDTDPPAGAWYTTDICVRLRRGAFGVRRVAELVYTKRDYLTGDPLVETVLGCGESMADWLGALGALRQDLRLRGLV